MIVSSYRPPLDESLFVLEQVIGWRELFALPDFAHADAELASAVLTEGARFAASVLGPINAAGDAQGCVLDNGRVRVPPEYRQAFADYAAGGWTGLDMPRAHGGQDLPLTVQVAFAEMVNGASLAFGMVPITMRAGGRLLLEHADAELAARIVPKLVSGEWGATICITESHAGSDVARLRTRAVPRPDGSFELSGGKIFISFADHDLTPQIIHLVLARTGDAASGSQGLSLFAVPARRFDNGAPNGITVVRLEKKMGLKASPTCVLELDRAQGTRIGAEGQGLKCMFTMMNLMRLEVAVEGIGLAQSATDKALDYAAGRPQGGAPDRPAPMIDSHADVRRMLLIMQSRTAALRVLTFEAARQLDLARAAGSEAARNEARRRAEFLLPVCKTGAAEAAFETCSLAVQVFGGHGYVADHGVEQLLRDSRILAIYEGTSGIQAFDLLARKVIRDEGARYTLFMDAVRRDLDRAAAELRQPMQGALSLLDEGTAALRQRAAQVGRHIEAAAYDYLQLVVLVACGWSWLRLAAADPARVATAHFFMKWLMPQAGVHAARLRLGSGVIDAAWR
jgi:alkylation response protein AidB-like acyl-CoA dehydrogenase